MYQGDDHERGTYKRGFRPMQSSRNAFIVCHHELPQAIISVLTGQYIHFTPAPSASPHGSLVSLDETGLPQNHALVFFPNKGQQVVGKHASTMAESIDDLRRCLQESLTTTVRRSMRLHREITDASLFPQYMTCESLSSS